MIISNKQQSPRKEPKRTKRVVKEWREWTDPLSASFGRYEGWKALTPWADAVASNVRYAFPSLQTLVYVGHLSGGFGLKPSTTRLFISLARPVLRTTIRTI